jgi:hypothetical protein
MIFDGLKAYAAIALSGVLAAGLAWQTYQLSSERSDHQALKLEVAGEREAWAAERTKAANALVTATTQARAKEQALTAAAHQSEEIKNAEIATLAARAADLRRRLRNAEASAATARLLSRAAAASAAGQVAGERDRPEFSGSLGYDVVSEAERADQIRFQLAACERQYESARAALK